MSKNIFKKLFKVEMVKCFECGQYHKKKECVCFGGLWFCSEGCMSKSFSIMSTERLIELNREDLISNLYKR